MIMMVLMGAFGTIINKSMDEQRVDGEKFTHPFFQTGTLFFGEFLCLVVYKINSILFSKSLQVINQKPINGIVGKLYDKFGKFIFFSQQP